MNPIRPELESLAAEKVDLLIVGGGINGAGTAREAAGRGLRVLLAERKDFASGASGRSTKLLHGGLRYLEHGDFALVAEALKERRTICGTLQPHATRPLPFVVPVYRGDRRSPWTIRAGLWLYDLLALKGRGLLHPHRWLGAAEAAGTLPALETAGLRGAGVTWDCQMDDARIVLENLEDARALGAQTLNYCSLVSARKLSDGSVEAVLLDSERGAETTVRAGLLVVAAGAWTDQVFRALGSGKSGPKVRPTKGVHLVTRRLVDDRALLVPARSDGRVFFVIPWELEGRPVSLIGTTDTDFKGDPDHVRAEEEDIDYLLKETVRVLPGERLSRTDVRATFAGLRPLSAASTPDAGASKVSREHTFWEEPGVLAVTGGKYTTYRSLCEALVERAARRLGRKLGPRFSGGRPLPGAPRPGENPEQSAAERLAGTDAPQGAPALLAARYGRYAGAVAELATENPNLARAVAPGSDCPAILAQAAWAARHERALHLDDFYLRRSRLGLLLPPDHRGVDAAATAMGRELGWDSDREARELERLKRAVDGEFR